MKVRARARRRGARCEYTNYCEALDQQHQQVTCQLWDREALDEPGVREVERRQAAAGAAGLGPGPLTPGRLPPDPWDPAAR